jgi:predicted peptidase
MTFKDMKNTMGIAILTLLISNLSAFSEAIPEHPWKFYAEQAQALTYTNAAGESLPYRLFLPKNYDATKKYPLVLVFHGAGQRGGDNRKHLAPYVAGWMDNAVQSKHPSILIIPQCPPEAKWVDTDWGKGSYSFSEVPLSVPMKLSKEILDQVMSEKSVDKNRVYVMGASMGGYGTWNFIMRYPELVAAAVPVCGAGDPAKAETLKDIPIWAFHGDKDSIVPPSGSQDMVDAITKIGGTKIKLTLYPGMDHGSYLVAWRDPALVEWLFNQSKSH